MSSPLFNLSYIIGVTQLILKIQLAGAEEYAKGISAEREDSPHQWVSWI